MHSEVKSGAVLGIDAFEVRVEVDIALGIIAFSTVGLPEGAVRESKVRVQAALKNAGFELPMRRITVNLAPADIRKDGTGFDVPIALGILAASGQIPQGALEGYWFIGELSLTGHINPVRGLLPIAVAVRNHGAKGLVAPAANAAEAAIVEGIQVLPVRHLTEVVEFICGRAPLAPLPATPLASAATTETEIDFADIRGQEHVKRALEVAAAGGHNALMIGPPGSGKTMAAKRLPTILPEMTFEEALTTSKIYSVAGQLKNASLLAHRPFRAPHHTISDVGLIGGGTIPRPGEISLAHNGVLFLDEVPEFKRNALEVMRQPLEDREVTITRSQQTLTFPANVTLLAAMNPCPCGYLGHPARPCSDAPVQVERYRSRISGPLLDRIDIHIEVPAVNFQELSSARTGETSAAIRDRVNRARQVQHERFRGHHGVLSNAQMTTRLISRHCQIDAQGRRLMEMVVDKLGMSARAYDRILKVARTIADLDSAQDISAGHLAEAIQYRNLDRTAQAAMPAAA